MPPLTDDATVEEIAAATAAAEAAAYNARSEHYFGLLLLESKPAFMHEVGRGEDGATRNNIERHHAILPNPSQKIASFALVNARTMAVQFVDKPRQIAGEERWLIPDGRAMLQRGFQQGAVRYHYGLGRGSCRGVRGELRRCHGTRQGLPGRER